MINRLGGVKFSIMSPEEIRKLSVLEIKSHELYDKDGFPVEGGLMDPHLGVVEKGRTCKTCGQHVGKCIGHFGHLELIRPIIHIGYFKKVDFLLNITCGDCGRMVFTEEEAALTIKDKKFDDANKALLMKSRTKTQCPHCEAKKIKVKLDPPTNFYVEDTDSETGFSRLYTNDIRTWFEKIQDSDLKAINFGNARPEWFIMTVLPIPPITLHPSITLESGIKSEDDLTYKLIDMIITNNRLKDNINAGTPQLIIEDLWNLLQYNVTTYFNNNSSGVPPAKHRSGRVLKTLIQRIKGKSGIIRSNLMGKRVNFSARSTISPDVFINVDEIGIPEYVSNILTVNEKVFEENLEYCKDLIKDTDQVVYVILPDRKKKRVVEATKELILEELAPGFAIERKLMNGDYVFFNRQPSLHRASIMAHKVKVIKGLTFRINPIAVNPYNADFDGDEMNVHVPQSAEGKAEAKELLDLPKQVLSPRHGGPVIVMINDMISGAFLLTLSSTKIPRDIAMNYFQIIGLEEPPKPDIDADHYSGKLIFSQLLHDDFNLSYSTLLSKFAESIDKDTKEYKNISKDLEFKIENGQLKSGVVDKNSLGEKIAKLILEIYNIYGETELMDFYKKLGRIVVDVVTRFGVTISLNEYEPSTGFVDFREERLDTFFAKTKDIEKKFKAGTLEKVPGKDYAGSFEARMMREASYCKNDLQDKIVKEKMGSLFGDRPEYNSIIMPLSGSRGNLTNLANISCLWGQIAVREKIPTRGYTKRILSCYDREDLSPLARGFITKDFYRGLSARELYFHAMGGRQGIVDSGVSTRISGYFYRRVSNALRDIFVAPDRSIKSADDKLIQFKYGDDGIYSQKAYDGELFYEEKLKRMLDKVK
jgi:DNA-directed RNA polymerase subunit A'